jgi:hypothetical protein
MGCVLRCRRRRRLGHGPSDQSGDRPALSAQHRAPRRLHPRARGVLGRWSRCTS